MSSRSRSLQSKRFVQKKRRALLKTIILAIVCVASLTTSCILLTRMYFFQIDSIEVVGNKLVDSKTLTDVAESYLQGNYFAFIPHHNIFLYPRAAIEKELLMTNPRLAEAHALRRGRTLVIDVTERLPVAEVCGQKNCFLMDSSSFIFAPAPDLSEAIYTRFIQKASATSTPAIGATFLDADTYHGLLTFSDSVTKLGLPATTIELREAGDFAVIARTSGKSVSAVSKASAVGTTSKMSTSTNTTGITEIYIRKGSFDQALTNLGLFLQKSGKKTFASIDLRYGNSIFFK